MSASPERRRRAAVALALFVLAAVPRLWDLGRPSLGTDEVKWIERGERFARHLERGNMRLATAHLMHPGIPVAAATAVMSRVREALPSLDPVASARLPFAVAGAAMAPLLYLAASPAFGAPVAALAGAFLALEPRHLAASRTAHLDVVFSIFFLAVLWAFLRRQRQGGVLAPLVMAVGLGLAQATRISGVIAVVVLVTYAALELVRSRRAVLSLRDLHLAIAGFAIFALLFTKLWLPAAMMTRDKRYPWTATAAVAVNVAAALGAAGTAAVVAVLGWIAWRNRRHLGGTILAVLAGGLAVSWANPHFVVNLLGYVANVVHAPERLHHHYFGVDFEPLPGKYLTVLAEGMPLVTFLPLFVGLPLLAMRSWRDRSPRGDAALLLVVAVAVFLAFASDLDKIASRYLMPVYPLLAIAAAWTWVRTAEAVRAAPAAAFVPAVLAGVLVLPVHPDYALWKSALGRRLEPELGLRSLVSSEGHDEAALWLWRHARPDDRVLARCYPDVLRFYWRRVLPARLGEPPKPMPRIGYFRLPGAEWAVLARRLEEGAPVQLRDLAEREPPAVELTAAGERVMRVYRVPRPQERG